MSDNRTNENIKIEQFSFENDKSLYYFYYDIFKKL